MTFTIPNLLSLFRMGLVPLFIIALLDGRREHALGIFLLAGVTDLLDGLIARFWDQQSPLGAYLDPLADKILMISAYTALAIPSVNPGPRIPLWVAVLVIARDLLILVVCLLLHLVCGVARFRPTRISKLTTAVQIVAVALVLAGGLAAELATAATVALYLAAALTVASGLYYVTLANRPADSGA